MTRAFDAPGSDQETMKHRAAQAMFYAAELFIAAYAAGTAARKIDPASLHIAYERTVAAYRLAKQARENDK